MPLSQSGVAGAVASTSRQTGAALGVAVLGSLVTSSIVGPFAAGFAGAARPAWVVMIGCGLAIVVLGILATGRRAVASATRTAALFDESPTERVAAAAAR
jgi:protein-S-isoprenylcysteine O-methyltransferase Ste14